MPGQIDQQFIALQEAVLGRFSLERVLGRGGMGTVYLAREVQLDRPVAIKVLHPDLTGRPEARARFLREARTAGRLSHPHIVPIYSVEEHETLVFFVMAHIDGETLGARLRRRGAVPPADTERALREIAWALGYAHAHGVIHRDLTLENVLLESHTGRALLADFGIASAHGTAESGPVFGTPGYLAPELIRGEAASPASDLYALGVVGFTLLSGKPPFAADTPEQLVAKHLVQPVPALAPLAPGASRRLVDAVTACLAREPDQRPADTSAFQQSLERVPEPVTVAAPLRRWFTRGARIRPIYALATPLLAMQSWLMIFGYFESGRVNLLTIALVTTLLSLTAIPLLAHFGFEMTELRQLRRAGFGVGDIRAALPHWQEETAAERRREGMAPLPGRVIFDLTVVGAVSIVIAFGVMWPLLPGMVGPNDSLEVIQRTLIGMMSNVYLATLTGIGVGFLLPGHRPSPDGWLGRLKQRFWNSAFAAALARVAATGQQQMLAPSSTLHRNTEMVLGLAVDDLWLNIPAQLQAELGDVPALAHTLQGGAAEMRELIDRLRESERDLAADSVEMQSLSTARGTLEHQHRDAVTALERLRLQLLRLLATRERTAQLTEHLEIARVAEATMLREIAAHQDLRRTLRRPLASLGAATPTPSPA